MADLPWFKFDSNAYLGNSISFATLEAQGLFILICALWWQKKRSVSRRDIEKRLRWIDPESLAKALLELKEDGLIDETDKGYVIKFLQKQHLELFNKHRKLSEAGRKGGLSKGKARLKHKESEEESEGEGEEDTLPRDNEAF